jgi:hypothetical protein
MNLGKFGRNRASKKIWGREGSCEGGAAGSWKTGPRSFFERSCKRFLALASWFLGESIIARCAIAGHRSLRYDRGGVHALCKRASLRTTGGLRRWDRQGTKTQRSVRGTGAGRAAQGSPWAAFEGSAGQPALPSCHRFHARDRLRDIAEFAIPSPLGQGAQDHLADHAPDRCDICPGLPPGTAHLPT